jgi:flagellar biosynthetic protein FliP
VDADHRPLRDFMLAQVRENDLMTFAGLAGTGSYASPTRCRSRSWSPAFITSELKTAFEIGF